MNSDELKLDEVQDIDAETPIQDTPDLEPADASDGTLVTDVTLAEPDQQPEYQDVPEPLDQPLEPATFVLNTDSIPEPDPSQPRSVDAEVEVEKTGTDAIPEPESSMPQSLEVEEAEKAVEAEAAEKAAEVEKTARVTAQGRQLDGEMQVIRAQAMVRGFLARKTSHQVRE